MNLNKFIVSSNVILRDALSQIERNHYGVVFVQNAQGAIVGLATDGDIRRSLIEGATLDDSVEVCINREFIWAAPETSREFLIKKLDHRIRIIPLLDLDNRLVGIVSREHMPLYNEEAVYVRARSPVRISFGGGGSDLTHYFAEVGGAVINTTISLYSHATLRIRDDSRVIICSRDLHGKLEAEDLSAALALSGKFGLIQSLLKAIKPEFGLELDLHSDFPLNSGLGGSAAVSAAVLGCFNQLRRDQWDTYELAELAFQSERLHLGIAGGWQDQYATIFGGFNFMEFRMEQNIVHPLRMHPEILLELEESLVLCDTGISHDSGEIHQDQRLQLNQVQVNNLVKINAEISYLMRNQLLRGHLLDFGKSLDKAWQSKRQLSSKISSTHLDGIYDLAKQNGAIGGKLLGAGGGGFFVFYVTPVHKHGLMNCLETCGLRVQPFRFEQEGLRSWTVRERRNHVEMKKDEL